MSRLLHLWRIVFVFTLAVTGSAQVFAADDLYDLRGPAPKKGQVFHENSKFTMKDADITVKLNPNAVLSGKMDMAVSTEKQEEILGVDGRNVTKLRTKVIKEETARKTRIGGMTENTTEKSDLHGEFVYSELTKDGWKHSLEDTKPTEQQRKALKDFDNPENDDELYPAEKVKVGHAWTIEGAAFKKVFGSKVSDVAGTGKSKFVRIENVGDEPYAVIETDMDIKAKMKTEGNDFNVEIKGKVVVHRSIKTGVDLKHGIEGTATFAGSVEADNQKIEMRFSGKMSGEGTTTIKKP